MEFYTNVRMLGNKVYYLGYKNGQKQQQVYDLYPTLYKQTSEYTGFFNLKGENLKPLNFDTVQSAREYLNNNSDLYGYEKFHYVWLQQKFQDLIQYDVSKLTIFYLDIETTTEYGFPDVFDPQEQVLLITIYNFSTSDYITFGTRKYTGNAIKNYVYCSNEEELYVRFLDYWIGCNPDIVSSWNGDYFDMPYLYNRMCTIVGTDLANTLSPWRKVFKKKVFHNNRECLMIEILGVSQLDYLNLYKKFTYTNQSSYSLQNIAMVELGEGKTDHDLYATFKEFYDNDFNLFCEYNLNDVKLLVKLDDKLKLIELILAVAYDAKINYSDVFSQVTTWDNIIFNFLVDKNVIVPCSKENQKDSEFVGAYVKEPVPSMYHYVVSFDVASLYPHIIQALNISPETLTPYKIKSVTVDSILNEQVGLELYTDFCVAPTGCLYVKNTSGMMSILMERYYNMRKDYKKLQLEAEQDLINNPTKKELVNRISEFKNKQMATKIAMNSCYGVLGCPYFRYYNINNAKSITTMGQVAIRWVSDRVNTFINQQLNTVSVDYIITNDTDSLFLNLEDLVKSFFKGDENDLTAVVDFICSYCDTYIQPFIDKTFEDLGDYLHFHKYCLKMVRDLVSSSFIIKGKKRYMCLVLDKEGVRYQTPKLKITGLEVARSSTPKFFRDKLKYCYELLLHSTNEDLICYIGGVRDEMEIVPISDIATTSSVSNLSKYNCTDGFLSSTPIHCRASIVYNRFLNNHNLIGKYKEIINGDKIKYIYLKMPNKLKQNVVAFHNNIPDELDIKSYVDYDTIYQNNFIKPLSELLTIRGWVIKKTNTLF